MKTTSVKTPLCKCGHYQHQSGGPCPASDGCEEFVPDGFLLGCGHLEGGGCDCEEQDPHVVAKRVDERGDYEAWIIDCPFCGREHSHSAEAGFRHAHCQQGDGYVLVAPATRRSGRKLPFRTVWDRDGWECVTCGSHKYLTVDHIIPVSRGGTDDIDNLQTMCWSCNSRKGNRT